ncbi:CDP-glycerol glycerophosphotransferase family protein [Virgibacillus pantothenticus]|uniref:CDP-glycerol glycerophosphotransferase family protein n=1 Tax=Virgibacillus pantothenticus TaxID=1473 RepID=UPI003D2CB686
MKSWFKRNKNKKNKIKQNLNVIQSDNELKISGFFDKEQYFTNELWLFSRSKEERYKIAKINPSTNFNYVVSLDKLVKLLEGNEEEVYDWYFKVRIPYSHLKQSKKESDDVKIIDEKGHLIAEYFIRCGRFQNTTIEGLDFYKVENNNFVLNYITKKGNLSLVVNNIPDSPTRLQIDKVGKRFNKFTLEGKIYTRNSLINKGEIILKGRESGVELSSNSLDFIYLEKEVKKRYGLNRYIYKAEINFQDITNDSFLKEDIYDLFLKLDIHDNFEPKYVRVGRPTFRAQIFLKDIYVHNKAQAAVVNPYYTFKRNNLSFEVYNFPIETYNYMKKIMRWAWLIRLLYSKKEKTWIVGERMYKAQDTGFAFFKYMRENHPNERVYYVIDSDSPERKNVEPYGNVVDFKSKRHILLTVIADKIISSHHPDYLYPLRTKKFKNKVKATKVFLQHGIMGTKNMVSNYGKQSPGFDTDLFMVSSDFEKEMIVNDFGYEPENVFVTGLSRFDTLFQNDVEIKNNQILIIPTWRDWIATEEDFLNSEYYLRYKSLINSPDFLQIAKKYNLEIIFCLHPNMQSFSSYFKNNSVRVINQGEVDVQFLIKQSALMITDYSSVAFDFSFLGKPILYYQFDRSRFIGNRPSHLDLNNDLPGEIIYKEDQLINNLNKYAKDNFKMKLPYRERAKKFIKYKDMLNSDRIYTVIKNNKVKKHFWEKPKLKLFNQAVFNKFRKSKLYFPTMKTFYKIGLKVIPVDDKLILFESGIGKQFGDSPKNIYEEILNQNLNFKKVWVYNKSYRFSDVNTKRVKRLSPQYYYYLLRSKYWVNNQNFPSYISKRPETIYLQTWHGTPLKKMLFDLEEVHGRAEDYLERVGNAVKYWDYLISPSRYATTAFRSAFNYKNEIIELGYPRNDIFYQDKKKEVANKVLNRLNIDKGKKVILYAPTFRDDQTSKKNKFSFDVNMDLHQMKERLSEDYIILLRMHVVVSNKLQLDEELTDFVQNVSSYPDIQELLLITDILITDYSSVMFDFANTGKPMLFFTYDLTNYRDNIRGFYFDFEKEAPGPLVFNTEEIVENVLNIEGVIDEYKEKYSSFYNKFCPLEDGNAAKRVVEYVFK